MAVMRSELALMVMKYMLRAKYQRRSPLKKRAEEVVVRGIGGLGGETAAYPGGEGPEYVEFGQGSHHLEYFRRFLIFCVCVCFCCSCRLFLNNTIIIINK